MSNSLRMVIVLTITAMLSGLVLSYAYEAANTYIQRNEEAKLRLVILDVLPGAETYETLASKTQPEIPEDDVTLSEAPPTQQLIPVYRGLDKNGKEVGLAFIVENPGYGGLIRFIAGIDTRSNTLTQIQILEHKETPGLGSKIADAPFREQFSGKSIADPFVVGQDVDGISGATVSSKAVTDGLRTTIQEVMKRHGKRG
ncbi:MAG: RnfABCDGE type electron transport complex subunit G [Limnochordia bacterium]|jgi:electron transport complex protein RnfG|nr:RnfABCDGE type electron transport complex subunit G [Bacillota bacterium]